MSTTTEQSTVRVPGLDVRPGDTVIDHRGVSRRVDEFDPIRGVLADFFGPFSRVAYTCDQATRSPAGVFTADDEVTVTLPRPPQHTITIEAADHELVAALHLEPAVVVVVVERHGHDLIRVCATNLDVLPAGVRLVDAARSYALTRGAVFALDEAR